MVQKVAIYCRVSTTDQSCQRQERDLVEYAALSGYQVVGVWKETISGTKNSRTERSVVMALAQSHKIGVQPGYAQIGTRCKVMLRRYLQMLDFALFQHQFERATPRENIP